MENKIDLVKMAKGIYTVIIKNRIIIPVTISLLLVLFAYYQLAQFAERVKRSEQAPSIDSTTIAKTTPINVTELKDTSTAAAKEKLQLVNVNPTKPDTLFYYTDKGVPLNTDSVKNVTAALFAKQNEKAYSPLLGFIILCIATFIAWFYFRTSFKKVEGSFTQAGDPDALKDAVITATDNLLKLSTPRKLKRIINKIRFQFQILKAEGLIADADRDKAITLVNFCHFILDKQDLNNSKFDTLKDSFKNECFASYNMPYNETHNKMMERLFQLNSKLYV